LGRERRGLARAEAAESTGTAAAVEIDWDVGDVVEVEVDEPIGVETIEAPIEIDWDVRGFVVEDAGDARAETNVEKETNGLAKAESRDDSTTNDSSSSRLRSGAPSPIASSALACWTTCSSSARFSRSARRMPARRANPRRFSRRRRRRSARVSATPPNF
jgi:hypothetical protein